MSWKWTTRSSPSHARAHFFTLVPWKMETRTSPISLVIHFVTSPFEDEAMECATHYIATDAVEDEAVEHVVMVHTAR